MQYETNLTPAQRELERELRTLTARPGQLDAIAAAFAAGQRSQMRNVRIWRSVAGLFLVVAAGSLLLPQTVRKTQSITSIPIVVNTSRPPAPQVSNQSLLILQEAVTRRGVDALPESRLPPVRSMGSNETL